MLIKLKNKDTLKLDDHILKCSIGRNGLKSKKEEGDKCTPKGVFSLGKLYYRADRVKKPTTKISTKIIKKNMGWCDDVTSKFYNKEMKINKNISNDISHAYVYYTIIQLVRLVFQYDKNNKKKTIKLIRECISETKLQNNLKHYKPKSGDSKIIPFLIKTNQPLLLLYICRIKGMIR